MHRPAFVDDEIYHVYNRGVDKRVVYIDSGEYLRFVHHLYEFNDIDTTNNLTYHFLKNGDDEMQKRRREHLVDILAFALMPNHYHLLLKQRVEGGISKFMQKVGTGYTLFFNEKHARSGSLFQGRFKAVHVTTDVQLRYVLHYIHLNPLALLPHSNDPTEMLHNIKEYKWSSLPDYTGSRSFPSVTHRLDMLNMFDGTKEYERSFLQNMKQKAFPNGVDSTLLLDHED